MLESMSQLYEEIRILKEYTDIETDELEKTADAIEREVEERYVELPKDKDGEHIHIGDRLMGKHLEGNQIVECTRLTLTNGWMVGHGRADGTPNLFIHHKPTTVEDVLREFAEKWGDMSYGSDEERELFAEYAKRLQLREE